VWLVEAAADVGGKDVEKGGGGFRWWWEVAVVVVVMGEVEGGKVGRWEGGRWAFWLKELGWQ